MVRIISTPTTRKFRCKHCTNESKNRAQEEKENTEEPMRVQSCAMVENSESNPEVELQNILDGATLAENDTNERAQSNPLVTISTIQYVQRI